MKKQKSTNIQKQNAKNLRNNPTIAEAVLWKYLRKKQINGLKFRRQQPIGNYIVDFCCFYPKIIIELDGGQHNNDKNIKYDSIRDEFLRKQGFQVIRIWNNEIFNNINGVVEWLRDITHPEIKDFDPPVKGGEGKMLVNDSQSFTHPEISLKFRPSRQGRVCKGYGACFSPLTHPEIKDFVYDKITVQCPAKINLTLKITDKRPDGFHNIESVMQTISLYDYLTIDAEKSDKTEIILTGNNKDIPYDEKNLVYKAAKLFFEKAENLNNYKINIFINKNIPIAAGLAGGSTDAAGTIFGLNEIFDKPFTRNELHKLCAQLGSDLNVCLEGGKLFCTGRGENIKPMEFEKFSLSLIKPENLGISAKEAYMKFECKVNTHPEIKDFDPPVKGGEGKMLVNDSQSFTHPEISLKFRPSRQGRVCKGYGACFSPLTHPEIKDFDTPVKGGEGKNSRIFFDNDLEWAIIDDYPELQKIKELYPNSIMSGSGSTYFVINDKFEKLNGYQIFNNLTAENQGCCIIERG